VDRAFAGVDFADLDESFEAYLQKL